MHTCECVCVCVCVCVCSTAGVGLNNHSTFILQGGDRGVLLYNYYYYYYYYDFKGQSVYRLIVSLYLPLLLLPQVRERLRAANERNTLLEEELVLANQEVRQTLQVLLERERRGGGGSMVYDCYGTPSMYMYKYMCM